MNIPDKSYEKHWKEGLRRVKAAVPPMRGGTLLKQGGFTLIELLFALIIVGILATLALPSYKELVNLAKITRCSEDIRTIEKAVIAYQAAERGALPPDLNAAGMGNIKDPWGRPYVYEIVDGRTTPYTPYAFHFGDQNTDFDLYSKGEDGVSLKTLAVAIPMEQTSQDDVVRVNNGGWVGIGSKYY